MKVIIGELPIDEDGFFVPPENGLKLKADEYVKLYPEVYRIEEREDE